MNTSEALKEKRSWPIPPLTIKQLTAKREPAQQLTGASVLVSSLLAHQVETVFGYPGGAIMPVYDCLYHIPNMIHHVLVRHEQGATHAAEGYARASGKVGVCLATSGPGATNLVTGIADAMLDSVPIVCIAGQVNSSLLGKNSFQEADLIGITKPICKWNYQITNAVEIPRILAHAFHVAQSGRPGPVLISVTKDAQVGLCPEEETAYALPLKKEKTYFAEDSLKEAARLINSAQRPFALIGQGAALANAEEEVLRLIRKAQIPASTTLLARSVIPVDEQLNMGMVGMHGNYAPNKLTNRADVIIAIGTRFSDRITGDTSRYAKRAKIIHIDIDHSEIGKNVKEDVGLVGDAKDALNQLLPLIHKNRHTEWLEDFSKLEKLERDLVADKAIKPQGGKIRMSEAIHLLSELTKGKGFIVADVGQHQMMTARYYGFNHPKSFITSGGLGTMGFALPAAAGACIALPERQVIAIMGDGCFQMNMQELATVKQEELPLKMIILNNEYLGMVRQWQELFCERRYSCTALSGPDYLQLAASFGIKAKRVTAREHLANGIKAMLQEKDAFLLEVCVEDEENVFPMIPAGAAVDEMRLE